MSLVEMEIRWLTQPSDCADQLRGMRKNSAERNEDCRQVCQLPTFVHVVPASADVRSI